MPLTLRLYGRRKGRPLNARKKTLIEQLLPRTQVVLPESGSLDPSTLFVSKNPSAIWLEIGFGGGEHLAAMAERQPNNGFIGCEPFINGVAGLLDLLDEKKLTNVRVFPDDARALLDTLPDQSLDGCFILYPDPWPKKRHAERRFINPENLGRLARTLKTGAGLRLATDVPLLADWMQEKLMAHSAFEKRYDSSVPPADWFVTRYEKKGKSAGRQPVYLIYRRR